MLVQRWDAPVDEAEWQQVLSAHRFGVLQTVGTVDGWPVAVPTQFSVDGPGRVLLHLARPNPVWRNAVDCP